MTTPIKVNRIGLEPQVYKGGKTTLCAGCGHNAISERIIDAFYEMGVNPAQVIKLSGIGCSSKSPAYFLGGSHGFNAVHGSGFRAESGINFEGPAPRPLERARIVLADDGQLLIDKARKFQYELGQWTDPEAFLKV